MDRDGDDNSDLVDAAVKVRGRMSEKQLSTAKNHFNDFLLAHGNEHVQTKSYDTISHEEVTAELLGRFGTYLFLTLNKPSGALSYLSQMKSYYTKKWNHQRDWSLHRSNCNGDQAPPMYRNSLRQVALSLFAENCPSSLHDRDLLVTQWHCMGRAAETGLRHSSIKFIGKPTNTIQFCVGRSKTNKLQFVHAFCDSESWEADVFHSMACHLITATNIDEDYHFQAASANVVNRILARAWTNSNKVIEKFQSHSSRRGSASEAMSHTGVSVPEVIARGGWSFDSLNRAFLYFSAMDRGDMRVGRVLAGWADSDHGGVPVMFDAIPTNEQPMFQSLTRHLFRHVLAKYDEHLLLALSSSLISYYNIVESEWVKRDSSASCFNHDVVRRSLNTVGGNDFILSKWSSILRESWLISNLLWLGHDQISGLTTDIKDKATVSALTLEKKLDLLAAGQHESAKQLARLVNIVAEQQAQVVALTHTVKQLSDATSALEKTLTVFAHTRSNEPTNAYQSIQPKAPVINSGVVSVPFSTAHVVPIPKSLKNMRASFVFLEFYSNRWYALPLSPNEKEIMRKIRLVVGRVKDFLPADCILTLPPRPDDKKFGKWQTDLDRHARLAEKSMLQYISQIKPHITKRERAFLFANSVNKDLAQATSRDDYPKRVHTDNTSVDV